MVGVVVLNTSSIRAAPRLPDEPTDRLDRRDTPVTASLTRHREPDQATHGHLVGQGAELDGGPVDQGQGAGSFEDVGVDVVVQAGTVAHRRVVGWVAQDAAEVEVEAVCDEGVGAVVTDADRGDDGGDQAAPGRWVVCMSPSLARLQGHRQGLPFASKNGQQATRRGVSGYGRKGAVRGEEGGPVVLRPRAHLGTGPDPCTPYRHGLARTLPTPEQLAVIASVSGVPVRGVSPV